MTDSEEMKLARRIVRIRRALHTAESYVYLDDPKYEDLRKALDYLQSHVPEKVIKPIFKSVHLRKLTNFWLSASDRGQVRGPATADQVTTAFRKLAQYCNREEIRHDDGQVNIVKPPAD